MPGFISRIPILGWVLGAIAAYGLYRGKEELDEARGRRQQQRRMEPRARKVQVKIGKDNAKKSQQEADARASAPSGVTASEQLPDSLADILISDRGSG